MPRLLRRPGSFRTARLSIEELECRAQPAILGFAFSVTATVGFDHAADTPATTQSAAFTSVNVTLPAQANVHAQTEIIIRFGSTPTPPTDSGGSGGTGSGNSGGSESSGSGGSSGVTATSPGSTSSAGSAPALAVFSTSTQTTVVSSTFARELASVLSGAATAQQVAVVSTLSFASASLGTLLPPGRGADVTTFLSPSTNAALPSGAQGAQTIASQGTQATNTASIPYLGSEGTRTVALFSPTDAPVAALTVAGNYSRPGATPVKASLRLDQAVEELPANLLAPPALLQAPVEEVDSTVDDAVPMAMPVTDEGPTSPWVWASVLGGAAVGTAWVVWQYWLKPTPALRQNERAWRNYLLGHDFNRL